MTPKGKLIAIGGNENKGQPNGNGDIDQEHFIEGGILRRFCDELKGDASKIEVITSASKYPEEVGRNYLEAFDKLGVSAVKVMHIDAREKANNEEYLERIREADGILISGGDQLKLTSLLGGTELLNILKDRYMEEEGFVLAGTSAGAMCMSNTMIYRGNSSAGLYKGEVKITTGLAFITGVIIDSHFVKRGRFSRLTQTVAANPSIIGIGLGEDTGIVISEGNSFETIGSGQVIIFDGHEIRHSNIADIDMGEALSIERMIVHIISKGNFFYLKERTFSEDKLLEFK